MKSNQNLQSYQLPTSQLSKGKKITKHICCPLRARTMILSHWMLMNSDNILHFDSCIIITITRRDVPNLINSIPNKITSRTYNYRTARMLLHLSTVH
jgi:hypothetical protein